MKRTSLTAIVGAVALGVAVVPAVSAGAPAPHRSAASHGGVASSKGCTPAPKSLPNPNLTGFQLIQRFFNNLNPGSKAKLTAFLADSFIIKRSNMSSQNKATYLAAYPAYPNWGILVNEAVYADAQLSVNATNWQTTVPNVYTPSLYTFAWVKCGWQMTSFAKFANATTLQATLPS
jgi:hypothetical protein